MIASCCPFRFGGEFQESGSAPYRRYSGDKPLPVAVRSLPSESLSLHLEPRNCGAKPKPESASIADDLQLDPGDGDRPTKAVGEDKLVGRLGPDREPIQQRAFRVRGQVDHPLAAAFAQDLQARTLPRMLRERTADPLESLDLADS